MIRGILEAARRGATKTDIVYKSNLNFKIADQCLAGLLKAGYMTIQEAQDGKVQFFTTDRGMGFLAELTRLGKVIAELLSEKEEGRSERTENPQLVSTFRSSF